MSTTAPDALATQAAPVEHDWAANPKIRWYRSPLPIAELRALSQRRTLRPLLHCVGFLALLTVTGGGAHPSPPELAVADSRAVRASARTCRTSEGAAARSCWDR